MISPEMARKNVKDYKTQTAEKVLKLASTFISQKVSPLIVEKSLKGYSEVSIECPDEILEVVIEILADCGFGAYHCCGQSEIIVTWYGMDKT